MSPRRSSRARSSQQPTTVPLTNSSSSSSTHSTKGERAVRLNNNNNNPRASTPIGRSSVQRSESVDDTDPNNTRPDQMAPRRSRRGAELEKDITTAKSQLDEDDEAEVLEEEVTRCICGHAEYPGPSASIREQFPSLETLSDDVGNFFVQCDRCHVWQHGGCMGLTDESMLPEEYYCEQCKPGFHKIIKAVTGTKSSRYLPVLEGGSTRSSPLSSTADSPRKKDSKNKLLESGKRRATMNSRGAYDEDEMLRRAIEESKHDGTLGKRTRDDTEDPRQMVKRQRTGSSVSTTSSKGSQSPQPTLDEHGQRTTHRHGKLRGAAARNNREKELRDKQKEQMASLRAEAASKRNARSERRRVDESPPPTPTLSPTKATQSLVTAQKSKIETPPNIKTGLNRKIGSRPPARRGRVGRNQYTRDLGPSGDASDTPFRDTSQDRNGGSGGGGSGGSPHNHNNNHHTNGAVINGESGRSSKAKTHPARTSMNEMKRRVAAILEFVGQMQTQIAPKSNKTNGGGPGGDSGVGGVDSNGTSSSDGASIKGDSTPNGAGGSSGTTSNSTSLPTSSLVQAVVAGLQEASSNNNNNIADGNGVVKLTFRDEKDFESMASREMMEALTSELVQWQNVYGVYSR